jgi:hypothetical protein
MMNQLENGTKVSSYLYLPSRKIRVKYYMGSSQAVCVDKEASQLSRGNLR